MPLSYKHPAPAPQAPAPPAPPRDDEAPGGDG
jgi:hypothetical protein